MAFLRVPSSKLPCWRSRFAIVAGFRSSWYRGLSILWNATLVAFRRSAAESHLGLPSWFLVKSPHHSTFSSIRSTIWYSSDSSYGHRYRRHWYPEFTHDCGAVCKFHRSHPKLHVRTTLRHGSRFLTTPPGLWASGSLRRDRSGSLQSQMSYTSVPCAARLHRASWRMWSYSDLQGTKRPGPEGKHSKKTPAVDFTVQATGLHDGAENDRTPTSWEDSGVETIPRISGEFAAAS